MDTPLVDPESELLRLKLNELILALRRGEGRGASGLPGSGAEIRSGAPQVQGCRMPREQARCPA